MLEGTRTGLLAMKHLLEWRDRLVPDASARPGQRAPVDHVDAGEHWLARLASGPISGAEAFALLAAYGIESRCRRSR